MNTDVSEKLKTFFLNYPKLEFAPKEYLIRPNTEIKFIYYLAEGNVRQHTFHDGMDVSLYLFSPGAYIPMMIVFSNEENSYFFSSVDTVVAYKAPKEDVLNLVHQNSEIAFDLTTRFAKGLCKLIQKTETEMYQNAYSRVESILLFLAQKLGKQEKGSTIINIPITHSEIASWAGIQRETASRQLEILSEKGIIKYTKSTLEINTDKLILDKNS
jgi:CRP/FNR family transcriptional regulator, anaerobic regulatory protein